MATRKLTTPQQADALLTELRSLIESARQHVAQTANATQTMLYWHVGLRVQHEVLKNGRAEKSLRRMVQFAEVFPDENIVATLSRELSWSHFVEILPLKQPLEREYYAELCRVERWSVRTLRERIASQLSLTGRARFDRRPDEKKMETMHEARHVWSLDPRVGPSEPIDLHHTIKINNMGHKPSFCIGK